MAVRLRQCRLQSDPVTEVAAAASLTQETCLRYAVRPALSEHTELGTRPFDKAAHNRDRRRTHNHSYFSELLEDDPGKIREKKITKVKDALQHAKETVDEMEDADE